jgi:DNA-binding PadR family transcriptional regulator
VNQPLWWHGVSVGKVKRVIGGVEAREIILRQLLDGPQTGIVLRAAIGRRVKKPVDEVSDAMLYFNLQHLENNGLIERFRDGKEKAARIVPGQIQSVRRVLGVEAPIAYIGAIDEDPGVLQAVPKRIRAETTYRPEKYHYFVEEATRRRLSGLTAERVLHEVPADIFYHDLGKMYELVYHLSHELIREYAILIDVTGGGKVCALALYQLAIEFDLPCIFVTEMGTVTWMRR